MISMAIILLALVAVATLVTGSMGSTGGSRRAASRTFSGDVAAREAWLRSTGTGHRSAATGYRSGYHKA